MRVLIVDDEEAIREVLTEMLQPLGYEVATAADGLAGLEQVGLFSPEAVVCDLKMPRLGGLEFLQRLSEEEDAPAVIMLSAFGEIESAVKALQLGACDYLLKPVQSEDLARRLARLVAEKELREQAAEERRRSVVNARMAAVGQLAAGVCHEINNPITTIRGNGQLLRDLLATLAAAIDTGDAERMTTAAKTLAREAPELLDAIQQGTERVEKITLGLMHFADSQSYEPIAKVSLNACVEDALLFVTSPTEGGGQIEQVLSEDLPLVEMRRRDIVQAILCLLLNARQAVGQDVDATIRITTERASADEARLLVEDSGSGVPADLREKIFEPFYTTREVGQGTGLGLSIVYGTVVKDHGGEVDVGASPLGGARFSVTMGRSAILETESLRKERVAV